MASLTKWTAGQAPSERLAAQVLLDQGYTEAPYVFPNTTDEKWHNDMQADLQKRLAK